MEGKKREMETQEGRKSRREYRMEGVYRNRRPRKKKKKKKRKKKEKKKRKKNDDVLCVVWGVKIRGGKKWKG